MALIDTDVLVDITKKAPSKEALEWFESLEALPAVPQVVALEVLYGARNKSDMKELRGFLSDLEVVFHTKEDQIKAQEIIEQYKLSHGVGVGDALIAATAIRLDETLFSLNRKHFAPIEGLKLEVPYEKKND